MNKKLIILILLGYHSDPAAWSSYSTNSPLRGVSEALPLAEQEIVQGVVPRYHRTAVVGAPCSIGHPTIPLPTEKYSRQLGTQWWGLRHTWVGAKVPTYIGLRIILQIINRKIMQDWSVQYVQLRGSCPVSGGGSDQSIGSTVSDAIVSSWLWSTTTRSFPLGYFSKWLQVVANETHILW